MYGNPVQWVFDDMEIEWDDAKAAANLHRRGIDFVTAVEVLSDPHKIERLDQRFPYGEERIQVIGSAGGQILLVVYTLRSNRYRIISVRRANRHERAAYHALHG